MPHSSGGGSHSSGSFHSSSSSSRSSHNAPPRKPLVRSHTHFPHSRRYVYYRHDGPHFIYVDRDVKEANEQLTPKAKLIIYAVSIVFIAMGLVAILTSKVTPSKLQTIDTYKVIDSAEVIEDETKLENTLKEFDKLTGIPVVIKTVNNEEWINNYGDIENYAYEQYLLELQEEAGWLILYSEPSSKEGFNDWYWHGMQGDYTDNILTSSITNSFGDNLQDELLRQKPLDEALVSSFELISKTCMKTRTDSEGVIGGVIMIGIGLFVAIIVFISSFELISKTCMKTRTDSEDVIGGVIMIGVGLFVAIIVFISSISQKKDINERGYKDSELQEVKDEEVMETCPFCGKEFFKGNFKKCPYCSGVLYL